MLTNTKGYRPKSLTNRPDYGLDPEQLADYLISKGREVPLKLKQLLAERLLLRQLRKQWAAQLDARQ